MRGYCVCHLLLCIREAAYMTCIIIYCCMCVANDLFESGHFFAGFVVSSG